MKSLYRRYRPLKLSDVIGQDQVTKPLDGALKQGKISHAYLFIGPRGCGKTSVARIFAHEVNGFPYETEDDYVDIIEIDGASNRGIDNIRDLREKVAIAPSSGKYKIYIIDEVHMLTKEAFNALLKTLEEPPAHVIFIMATTDAYKVPVTITSRAQTFTFKLADSATMLPYLKNICAKEKIKISDDALEIIVKRGGGSFRDSLSLLDQISTLSSDEITKEMVVAAMGLPEDDKIEKLLSGYTAGDTAEITTTLKDLLSSGIKPETLAEEMMSLIIEKPRPELMPLLAKLPEIRAPFGEAKLLVALMPCMAPAAPVVRASIAPVAPAVRPAAAPATKQPSVPVTKQSVAPTAPAKNPSAPAAPVAEQPVKSTPDKEPNAEAAPAKMPQNNNFSWGDFVERVQSLNDAISMQLKSVKHEVTNNTINIYPTKKVSKLILTRDNNKRILIEAAGGMKVVVHDVNEHPESEVKDELVSKISAIMGGEVQNDRGGNPF